jgi:hypothetical protein
MRLLHRLFASTFPIAALVTLAPAAPAAAKVPEPVTMTLSPASGRGGTRIVASGTATCKEFEIEMMGDRSGMKYAAQDFSADSRYRVEFTVPKLDHGPGIVENLSFSAGCLSNEYRGTDVGPNSGSAGANFTYIATPGTSELARTGSNLRAALGGLITLLAGVVLLFIANTRRNRRPRGRSPRLRTPNTDASEEPLPDPSQRSEFAVAARVETVPFPWAAGRLDLARCRDRTRTALVSGTGQDHRRARGSTRRRPARRRAVRRGSFLTLQPRHRSGA